MYRLEGTGSPSTYNTYLRAFFHNFTARVVSYAVTTYSVSVKSGWFWVVVEDGRLELNMDKKKKNIHVYIFRPLREGAKEKPLSKYLKLHAPRRDSPVGRVMENTHSLSRPIAKIAGDFVQVRNLTYICTYVCTEYGYGIRMYIHYI